MISVDEARARILSTVQPLPADMVALPAALGRVLAEPVRARVTQPPWPVAAMDGYAVRAADITTPPATLTRIGEAAAGGAFAGCVASGMAVRIFTGAPLPEGADTVVMQEDTCVSGDGGDGSTVTVQVSLPEGRHVRVQGQDFTAGAIGLDAGRIVTARDIGVAAAMNVPWLMVHRRPRVAILATGDEVVMPGDPLGPNQILSSNGLALVALVTALGGEALNLGIAPDDHEALAGRMATAAGADLLVTTGGASVGERDLVRAVLIEQGGHLDFWKIAMRPGKPLMFGYTGAVPLLGLPGNPVSSQICALLFLKPLLRVLQGLPADEPPVPLARLAVPLPANDARQEYLRASLSVDDSGNWRVTPFSHQDSALTALLARADALVVRPPHAPPAVAGALVPVLPLTGGCFSV